MAYKILIDKSGTPKLVEVPEKPKSCNDRKIPCCGGTRGCTTHCGLLEHDMVLYKLNTEKALSDESKWIAFKDVVATKNLLWVLLDDFRKPLQGKTFDLPENIGVSFEVNCDSPEACGHAEFCLAEDAEERCTAKKLAILSPQEPESVPSCGDGWISVKDQLPKDEVRYLVAGDYNAPIGYIELAQFNEIELDGSHWISGGFAVFPTHWQPLPKAPL